jgi:hypothetical protein
LHIPPALVPGRRRGCGRFVLGVGCGVDEPTESPERRAASRATSRASGRTPLTCQGTCLMLAPTFPPRRQWLATQRIDARQR